MSTPSRCAAGGKCISFAAYWTAQRRIKRMYLLALQHLGQLQQVRLAKPLAP